MTSVDDRPPQLGYLVVSGRRGPVATPAFFGVTGDRYWIAARRSTAKVRHLARCNRASLLMPARNSWRLVTGHVKVFDPLRPASLLRAFPDLVSAPGGLLDHMLMNGRSVLDLWTARPDLPIEIAKASKVLICLRTRRDRERSLPTLPGRDPLVVVATEVDSYPVAAMARRESREMVRLPPGGADAILPHAGTADASITDVSEDPVDADGSVALGRVTRRTDTEVIFRQESITRWSGVVIER